MSNITAVNPESATGAVKDLFNKLKANHGKVLNIFQCMGNSPPTLKGFLSLAEAAEETSLSPKLREKIALVSAETNHCNYCLAAHTAAAKDIGIGEFEIIQSRKVESDDPKEKIILEFVKKIIDQKGNLSEEEVQQLKRSGVTDQEIVEIIHITLLNMFTNYFNHIAGTELDFANVSTLE